MDKKWAIYDFFGLLSTPKCHKIVVVGGSDVSCMYGHTSVSLIEQVDGEFIGLKLNN